MKILWRHLSLERLPSNFIITPQPPTTVKQSDKHVPQQISTQDVLLPFTTLPEEHLPRESPSISDVERQMKQKMEHGAKITNANATYSRILNLEDIARKQPFDTGYLTAINGWAYTILRWPDLPQSELQKLVVALDAGKLAWEIGVILHHAYPVIRIILRIFDRPVDSFITEIFSQATNGDIQDFFETLVSTRCWSLVIYTGQDTTFINQVYSKIKPDDSRWLEQAWKQVIHHFYAILPNQRQYEIAVQDVVKLFPVGLWEDAGGGETLNQISKDMVRVDKDHVIISNKRGFGDGQPFIALKHPDVLAEIKKIKSQTDLVGYLICNLAHPDPKVKETVLKSLIQGEVESQAIGVIESMIDCLADQTASVRILAADALWKLNFIEYAVDSLGVEYRETTQLFGPLSLTMTPADALRGLYLLKNAAPSLQKKNFFQQIVREKIDIDLD